MNSLVKIVSVCISVYRSGNSKNEHWNILVLNKKTSIYREC